MVWDLYSSLCNIKKIFIYLYAEDCIVYFYTSIYWITFTNSVNNMQETLKHSIE